MSPHDRDQLILASLPIQSLTMVTIEAVVKDTGLTPEEIRRAIHSLRQHAVGIVTRKGRRLLAIRPEYWLIAQAEVQRWWRNGGEQIALEARAAGRRAKAGEAEAKR